MDKPTFRFGDKYEVVKNPTSKFNTNSYATISMVLVLISLFLKFILERVMGSESHVPVIVFIILWVIAFVIPFFFFTKKLFRLKEVDIYLLLLLVFLIVSFFTIAVTGF